VFHVTIWGYKPPNDHRGDMTDKNSLSSTLILYRPIRMLTKRVLHITQSSKITWLFDF